MYSIANINLVLFMYINRAGKNIFMFHSISLMILFFLIIFSLKKMFEWKNTIFIYIYVNFIS